MLRDVMAIASKAPAQAGPAVPKKAKASTTIINSPGTTLFQPHLMGVLLLLLFPVQHCLRRGERPPEALCMHTVQGPYTWHGARNGSDCYICE